MRVLVERLGARPLFFLFCLPDLFSSPSHRLPAQLPTHRLPQPVRPLWTGRACLLVYILAQSPPNIIISTAVPLPLPPTSPKRVHRPRPPPSSPRLTLLVLTRAQPRVLTVVSPTLVSSPRPRCCHPHGTPRPHPTRPQWPPRPRRPRTNASRSRARSRPRPRTPVTSISAGYVPFVIDRITLLTFHHPITCLPFSFAVLSSVQHYSHGPYPPSFYPYPYHHQNMPHRVEEMTVDRSIRFAPPLYSYKNARHPHPILTSHSHRSDGPAQYQFMPHSHPTPPPIATLHHSPALSASSLDSNSISPSPPVCSLPLLIAFPPFDASPSYRLRSRRPRTTLTRSQLRP